MTSDEERITKALEDARVLINRMSDKLEIARDHFAMINGCDTLSVSGLKQIARFALKVIDETDRTN